MGCVEPALLEVVEGGTEVLGGNMGVCGDHVAQQVVGHPG